MPATRTILVIGGGISGLTCAWRLHQKNLPVLLLEASPRAGGIIDLVEQNGFRFDIGPQSFRGETAILDLVEGLGISAQLCQADSRAPRYILQRGRLVAAPLDPLRFLGTGLFGWKTKLRALSDPFRSTRPPEGDESIASFVRRKFGSELLDNLAAPALAGVYAGDPEKLSLSAVFPALRGFEERHGSLVRGAMKSRGEARKKRQAAEAAQHHGAGAGRSRRRAPRLCNFTDGVVTLPNALAEKLGPRVRRGVEVLEIWRGNPAASEPQGGSEGAFQIACNEFGAPQSLAAAAIVMAAPTLQAGRLLASVEPRFVETLAKIEYASVAQVSAGYMLSAINMPSALKDGQLRGFGFLVPRSERHRLLGTVWSSALFPNRTPAGPEKYASFTSFFGGALDPSLCKLSESGIAMTARNELAAIMHISHAPLAEVVARWDRAIPQYNLGHPQVVKTLGELCADQPGIFLTGNYLGGPSLGACIEQANRTADQVAQYCAGLSPL